MPMTAGAASVRWGALRAVAAAMRSATAPGAPGLLTRVAALPRLTAAVLRREYTGAGLGHLLLMLGAVGYVVSPVDLVPEAVLAVVGLGDDAVVIGWLAVALIRVTDDFVAWEQRRARTVPGDVIG